MSWRQAFLERARSDDAVRRRLNAVAAVAICHELHYLQMATEKLAKAYISPQDDPPPQTHVGFVRLLQLVKQSPSMRDRLGYGDDRRSFVAYIDSLLPLARRVEQLAPALAGSGEPNAEYPWADAATGNIVAPAAFDFAEFDPADPKMIKLLGLFRALLQLDL